MNRRLDGGPKSSTCADICAAMFTATSHIYDFVQTSSIGTMLITTTKTIYKTPAARL